VFALASFPISAVVFALLWWRDYREAKDGDEEYE
jgi:hypothetical protein